MNNMCFRHSHSSTESRIACYNKGLSKKADKRLRDLGGVQMIRYILVKYYPPKLVQLKLTDTVEVYYFYRGERK